jgi:hypothetical protein
LPTHKNASDLDIHHLDSLDLVDFSASIEFDELRLEQGDFEAISRLNTAAETVRDLMTVLLHRQNVAGKHYVSGV